MVGAGSGGCRDQLLVIIARAAEQNVDDVAFGGNVAFGLNLVVAVPMVAVFVPREKPRRTCCSLSRRRARGSQNVLSSSAIPFWRFGFVPYIQNRQPNKSSLNGALGQRESINKVLGYDAAAALANDAANKEKFGAVMSQ